MVRKAALISLAMLVCGGSVVAQDYGNEPWRKRVLSSVGPMQKRMTAAAGDMVLQIRPEFSLPAVRVDDDIQVPAQIAGQFSVAKGEVLVRASSSKTFKACSLVEGRHGTPCLIDDDGDGFFDRAAKGSVSKAHPLPTPVRYTMVDDVRLPASTDLEARLIYQGGTGQTLRFSYREFVNAMAREPFTEEIEIPLGPSFPQDFAAKGAVFRLYSVGPMGIDFSVESYRGQQ